MLNKSIQFLQPRQKRTLRGSWADLCRLRRFKPGFILFLRGEYQKRSSDRILTIFQGILLSLKQKYQISFMLAYLFLTFHTHFIL